MGFFRDLRFSAIDSNTGRKLEWLLVKNGHKNKTFAIFFPEVSPGMQMKLHISYFMTGIHAETHRPWGHQIQM